MGILVLNREKVFFIVQLGHLGKELFKCILCYKQVFKNIFIFTVEQMKRKYYALRGAYRTAFKSAQPLPPGPNLSFLEKVWNIPPGGRNSIEAAEKNTGEVQKYKKGASPTENNLSSLANSLKPVLSIRKIDAVQVTKASPSKRGRPPKRQSWVQEKVESPKVTKPKPIVSQEQPIVDNDDEPREEGGDTKRCRYQCEVQMASTRESTPPRGTSTYASLSFEDDRQLAERRIIPSQNYDSYNDRPSHNYDLYNDRSSHNYDSYNDRPHNYDVYIDRPVRERSYSPPLSAMRRSESYFDPRRYPMIPTVPLDYHDDDMAFFRSLLTWTKRFSEEEKLEFRSEVMKLISRMRNYESAGNYYVISQTPLS